MKTRVLFLAAGFSVLSSLGLRGQPYSSSVGVPVKVWASAIGYADQNGSAQVQLTGNDFLTTQGDPSASISLSASYGATTESLFSTDPGRLLMEPGKNYEITVNGFIGGGVVSSVFLNMTPPIGYDIEIDRGVRRRAMSTSINHTYTVRLRGARDRVYLAAGASTALSNGQVFWEVGLGGLRNGKPAGALAIVNTGYPNSWNPWSYLLSPSGLEYHAPSDEIVVITAAGDVIRQIIANEAVADIVADAGGEGWIDDQYEIRFYHPDQVATGSGMALRTFTGDPYVVYRIDRFSGMFRITSTTRNTSTASGWTSVSPARVAATRLHVPSSTWPENHWWRDEWNTVGEPQISQQYSAGIWQPQDGIFVEKIYVRDPAVSGYPEPSRTRSYQFFSWGLELVGEWHPNLGGPSRSFQYYDETSASFAGRRGLFRRVQSSDAGNIVEEEFSYWDEDSTVGTKRLGQIKYRTRKFMDEGGAEKTYYEYADDPFGFSSRPALVETRINNVLTAKSVTAYVDAGTVDGQAVVAATREDWVDDNEAHALTTVTKFFREDTDIFYRNQPHSVLAPDHVQKSCAYQRGDFNSSTKAFTPSVSGLGSRVAVIAGTAGSDYTAYDGYDIDDLSLVDGKSTLELTIRDARAYIRRTETHVRIGGAWHLAGWTNFDYDTMGHLIERSAHNGALYTATYHGDQKVSETDETGVTLSYTYDAAGRVKTLTKEGGATTTYTYDLAGRVLTETVSVPDSADMLLTTRTWDNGGRPLSVTAPGVGVVGFSYPGAKRITTSPAGNTTEDYYYDGRLKSVTGSAVISSHYTYAVESGTGRLITTVRFGSENSPRCEKTWTDWLGRPVKTEKPGFSVSSQPVSVTENFYDDATVGKGRLYKRTRTGYAPTRSEYDVLGALVRTGLDVDDNGLVLASDDRITDTSTVFESVSGAVWQTSETKAYPTLGSPVSVVTAGVRTRLTGFTGQLRAESIETDVNGNTTTSTNTVDRAAKTMVATTVRTGFATAASTTTVNGLAVSATGTDGLTTSAVYDRFGRKRKDLSSRQLNGIPNATTYRYWPGTAQVQSVTDAADNEVSYTSYDPAGRVAWTRDAGNKYTRYAYTSRSELHRQWGDGTQPVQFSYNSYGERFSMSTYRSAPATDSATWPVVGPADTTTWTYDAASGLLHKKRDAANKEVVYDYNARGQLASRTWARGIATTYAYDPQTGEQTGIDYADATPDLAYTYNRLGQTATVTDATGTRTLEHCVCGKLSEEHLDATFFGGRVLTYKLDSTTTGAIGRTQGFTLGTSGSPASDCNVSYGYDAYGRFETLTDESRSRTFTYGYLSDASLVETMSVPAGEHAFTVTRGYEPQRDLLSGIEAKWDASVRARYDYTHNALGQRETRQQSGEVFGGYGGPTFARFGYNGRGELTSAPEYFGADVNDTAQPLPGRQHGYAYDSIGNRKWADRTGDPAKREDYPQVNNLNQYLQKKHHTVPVQGTIAADASGAAVVGAVTTARQGSYFAAEVAVANNAGLWFGPVTIHAAKAGGGGGGVDLLRTETRLAWLPQATQVFTYDLDGNMTSDGIWNYTWDAENRLIGMSTLPNALTGGFPDRVLEFKYDYMGRRVQKRVVDNSVTPATDVRHRYIYEGWNLIAEYAVGSPSSVLNPIRSYAWGLDLTGDLTKAGGVGALVQISDHVSSASYFPAYDGNGNVAALLNTADGAAVAVYEYTPFGELQRATGSYAKENPFRFSTKWTDDETGLVYYGRRYYDPRNGRFLGRDPIEEKGGLNLYGFVGNNAVNQWDYLGMEPLSITYWEDPNTARTVFLEDTWAAQSAWWNANAAYIDRGWIDGRDTDLRREMDYQEMVEREKMRAESEEKEVEDPNKEHPDCAGLRGRYTIAEKVLKDNGASFAEGGRYADQIGLLDNISGTSGAALVNTAAGVSLTYVGVRWAERSASLPTGNSIRNLGMAGLDFLATKAAILGIVYDVGNAVNSYANDRPLDAVQSGASGALTATALAIAQSNPYTAIAAGVGQVSIGAFEIGAQVYQNRVEEGRRLQSAQSSANLVSSAASKVNAIANEMREKGCK